MIRHPKDPDNGSALVWRLHPMHGWQVGDWSAQQNLGWRDFDPSCRLRHDVEVSWVSTWCEPEHT